MDRSKHPDLVAFVDDLQKRCASSALATQGAVRYSDLIVAVAAEYRLMGDRPLATVDHDRVITRCIYRLSAGWRPL